MNDAASIETGTLATEPDGWEWAFVEIFGHRSHWGRARQEERFGAKMIRIDVPNQGDPATHGWTTHYYGGSSIFSYSLVDEALALKRNKPYEPPSRIALAAPRSDSFDRDEHADAIFGSRDEDDGDNEEGA